MNHRRSRHLAAFPLLALFGAALAIQLGLGTENVVPIAPTAASAAPDAAVSVAWQEPVGPDRSAAPRACYDLQPGELLRLHCDLDLRAELQHTGAAPQQLNAGVAGELQLLVLARRVGDLALLASMPGATIRGGDVGAEAQRLRDELAQGTVVRMSTLGTIRGYRFPPTMSGARRNQFRTLFTALRATVGAPGLRQWATAEADATGEAEVAGRWDDTQLTLSAQKIRYLAGPGGMLPEVDGRTTAVLDPSAGWWGRFDHTEHATFQVPDTGLAVAAHATLRTHLCAREARSGASLDAFDWDASWAPASGAGEQTTDAMQTVDAEFARQMLGASLVDDVAQLRELLASGADVVALHEARRRLVWLLQHDSRAVAELAALLADPSLPPQVAAEVLSAAGSADTAATRALLAGQLAGSGSDALRIASAQALFQGRGPAAAALPAIRAALADGGAAQAVHGTSLLLLGALVQRADGDVALQELLAQRPFAAAAGLMIDWLEALGNAGGSRAVDAALPSFSADQPNERAAAISAIRKVEDVRVLAPLRERALQDAAPLVRTRAIESLAGRSAPDLLPLLEHVLGSDPDEHVREAALLAAAQAAEPRGRRRMLERSGRQDASPRLRRLALDLLAQRQP